MTLSGAIVLAACGLGCASLARAEIVPVATTDAPRMNRFNRKMVNLPVARTHLLSRVSKFQTSLDSARAASTQRAIVDAAAVPASLNRFVPRSGRAEFLVRPAAIVTPAAQRAPIRR